MKFENLSGVLTSFEKINKNNNNISETYTSLNLYVPIPDSDYNTTIRNQILKKLLPQLIQERHILKTSALK